MTSGTEARSRPLGRGGVRAHAERASSVDRFAARARARRRAPWRRVLIGLLAAAIMAGVVWLLWFSPYVVVRDVHVEGVGGDEAAAVENVAKVPLGQPMMQVDTGAITDRVRGRLTVAEARTSRSWPATITITVRPRTPALVLKNSQGQLEVVDATGVVYDQVGAPPAGVPLVTASSDAGSSKEALKAALSLIRALPADLADQITTISVSSANLVTFKLGEVDVVWGGADQPTRKVAILRALLKTGPTAIDVSAPDTPVTR